MNLENMSVYLGNKAISKIYLGDKLIKYGVDKSLIAYYKLNGNGKDEVGNNNLILNGTGNSFNGVGFDGTSCYSNTGSSNVYAISTNQISITSNMTISLWFNCSDFSTTPWIISNTNFRVSGIGFRISAAGALQLSYDYPTQGVNINLGTVQLNTWHNISVTIDSTKRAHMYLDGVDVGNTVLNAGYNQQPAYLILGKYITGSVNYVFKGLIDNVKIYNRTLASDEIQRMVSYDISKMK